MLEKIRHFTILLRSQSKCSKIQMKCFSSINYIMNQGPPSPTVTLCKAHKEWCFPRGTLFSPVLVFKNNELCLITGCWCETMNDHQLKWRGKKVKQIDTVSLDIAGKFMCLHTCCYFTKAVKHIFFSP